MISNVGAFEAPAAVLPPAPLFVVVDLAELGQVERLGPLVRGREGGMARRSATAILHDDPASLPCRRDGSGVVESVTGPQGEALVTRHRTQS